MDKKQKDLFASHYQTFLLVKKTEKEHTKRHTKKTRLHMEGLAMSFVYCNLKVLDYDGLEGD